MPTATTRPRDIIEAAAKRLADHAMQLQLAQDDHGVIPGPYDDLASSAFCDAAEPIYRETVGAAYLERIGLTFGCVDVLMELFANRSAPASNHERWEFVQRYYRNVANSYAADYRNRLGELPSLALATQTTPAVVRFDLLAGLASSAGVMRLFDAASWLAEIAPALPELGDVAPDPVALAALAVSST